MTSLCHDRDELDEVCELNRLFLRFLKQRLEARSMPLDLPASVHRLLGRADPEVLDTAAEFPRALFTLRLEAWTPWRVMDLAPMVEDAGYHAMQLSVLHTAWHTARRNRYSASLFLGLSADEIKRLRAAQLGELHGAAVGSRLVGCAFAQADWLWRGLLSETRADRRRQLRLIALQPDVSAFATPPRISTRLSR